MLGQIPDYGRSLEWFFDIDGDLFERQYKRHLSGYWQWKDSAEGLHAEQWRVFPENIGSRLSIDETSLSNGELYTIVTNKDAHGRKRSIVALVLGTDSDTVLHALRQIDSRLRNRVTEITLDPADSMHRICRYAFPRAKRVIDRFHVQKLALEAVQEIRINHRWDAINADTEAREQAKLSGKKYLRSASLTETLSRSYLPADAMPCSGRPRSGLPHKENVLT